MGINEILGVVAIVLSCIAIIIAVINFFNPLKNLKNSIDFIDRQLESQYICYANLKDRIERLEKGLKNGK